MRQSRALGRDSIGFKCTTRGFIERGVVRFCVSKIDVVGPVAVVARVMGTAAPITD
jgi:hypothetical protein